MSYRHENDPYYAPLGVWGRTSGGDVYQVATHCPYCGERAKNPIRRYEGAWFRLRCKCCGHDYKVCGRAS